MISRLLLIVILGVFYENCSSRTEPLHNATDFYQRLSNSRQTKRNLISIIKSQSGNSTVKELKSVYKVEFHVVMNALYDLLVHWGCRPTTIIYERETGFEFNKLYNFFHQQQCQPQLIVESDINVLHYNMFFESRYFVYIGNQHMLTFFTSISKSSELFSRLRTWIVISSYRHISHFESLLLRSFINSSLSQLTFLVPFSIYRPSPLSTYLEYGIATRVDLYDVFYSLSTLKMEVIPFAYWTSKLRLYFYHQIQDGQGLRGRTVHLITVKGTCPFVCLGGVNNSEILSSFLIDLFDAMKSTLNVNHILELSPIATVGIANPNGTYTGFVGQLFRGEKDIGLMACIITKERKTAVKYSSMNWNSELTITIRRPLPSIPPTIYVLSLHLSVWLTTGGFFAIAYALLMLIYRIFIKTNEQSQIEPPQENRPQQKLIKLDFFEQFIAGDYFSNWPSRIIMITWLIAFFLIFTYYTSILTSVFAFRDTKLPFETMEELAEKTDYCVFTVKDTSYHQAFQSAKEGTYKKIWDKMSKDLKRGLVMDFSTAYKEAAKRDKCAFFTNGKPFITIIQKDCQLMYLPNKYLKEHLGFPFRKDFPYIHLYSIRFHRLFEGGIFKRLEKIYINPEANKCQDPRTSQTLELPQVYMLFVFLLVTLSISIISLVIEKIYFFHKHLFDNKHKKNSIFHRKM